MKHALRDGSSVSAAVRRALILSAGAAAVISYAPAYAQQAAAAADDNGGPQLQEVVVTGSLIKRTDFDTPSPVQVINAESITQQGYTSVSQVLNTLSANGQGTLSQGFAGAFAGGASGVALRGLTVGATLTLIDGERMVAYPLSDDGQRSFVDISSIPLVAVDRIDVLKDGASAEFGSDAIAGVVNVVLKKNYQGFEASAEAGTTNHSDGTTERVGLIGGIGDIASDGYNAFLAVEWRHQDNILVRNRSGLWDTANFESIGGVNTTPGSGSANAQFGIQNPFPPASGPYLVPASATSFQNATGQVIPNKYLSTACPNSAALAADQCTIGLSHDEIQPQTGNINVIGRATKSMGDNWQAQVTGSWFRSDAEQFGTNPFFLSSPGNPIQVARYGPGFLSVTPAIVPVVPSSNPMNGTGSPLYPVAFLSEFGQQNTQFVTNTYRVFADISGKALGIDIDATAGVMYARTQENFLGTVNVGALNTAFANGYVLGTGGPLVANVAPKVASFFSNALQVVDIRGTRALFDLPGGPLSLGVGVDYNHRYLNATNSPDVTSGAYTSLNEAYAQGGLTDVGAFGEIVAPIVKGLEADASVRWDHFNNTGGDGVPKYGLKWSPLSTFTGEDNKTVTLRGTYGKGFRAPSPAEYRSAGAAGLAFDGADPILCPSAAGLGSPVSSHNTYPVQTKPQPGDVAAFCDFPVVQVQGTNPNLKPERSTNYTFGALFEPINNVTLSVDFWNIVIEDAILPDSAFPVLPFPPLPLSNVRTGPVTLPVIQAGGGTANQTFPQGEPIYSLVGYQNAGKVHVDGIDIDFSSHFDLGAFGKITPNLNWSHEIVWNVSSCYQGDCGTVHEAGTHGPSYISGDTGNPRDKAVFTLSWDKGPVDVTWTVNYTGPFTINDPALGEDTCTESFQNALTANRFNGNFPQGYCVVKEFTDVNLFASYNLTQNFQVFGSIQNLFNAKPPVDFETYAAGNDTISYDPSLDQAGAVGIFFDVGFKFKL